MEKRGTRGHRIRSRDLLRRRRCSLGFEREAAKRAVHEEVFRKLTATQFQIDRKPLWVSKDKYGHFHFVFSGSIGAGITIPEKCEDFGHEVVAVKFVNLAEIKVTPDPKRPGQNKLSLDGTHVLPISIGLIKLTM
jgi:hypothetical protein